jgi:type III secretion system YscQ/HrcQ family protein
VAQAASALGELAGLQPGDIWLSGGGWSIDASGSGRAVLCAPEAQRGVACDVSATQIVLGNKRIALSDPRWGMASNDSNDPLDQTLAEVPVVVRVELAQVTLPAAQWADLQPGDVLTVGKEVGGPVVLRAAGTVIAEGELVSVDGELGVRITRAGAPKGQ